MSKNEYPYIGLSPRDNTVLLYKKDLALHIDGKFKGEFVNFYCEAETKNITREYLANTYGKCESQEHADFICELARVNGFEVINDYSYSTTEGRTYFCFHDAGHEECQLYFFSEGLAGHDGKN